MSAPSWPALFESVWNSRRCRRCGRCCAVQTIHGSAAEPCRATPCSSLRWKKRRGKYVYECADQSDKPSRCRVLNPLVYYFFGVPVRCEGQTPLRDCIGRFPKKERRRAEDAARVFAFVLAPHRILFFCEFRL
ncbi:MAG: hypothetical protein V1881_01105 [Candidatus Micrarchaeota archaeon]